jgi:hypothetical protein
MSTGSGVWNDRQQREGRRRTRGVSIRPGGKEVYVTAEATAWCMS